jgi:nucleotide-binding universal stress UspA family protein
MARFRKLLVPIDGSPPSIAALEHAVGLAEEGDATIDALYVDAPDEFEVGSSAPETPRGRDEAEHEMSAALERARTRLGERVSRLDVAGDPLLKIIEVAGEGDYDLIVVGTHGRIGRLHSILGSVAEGIVRSAPCPVLTVREAGGASESFSERLHHTPGVGDPRPHR